MIAVRNYQLHCYFLLDLADEFDRESSPAPPGRYWLFAGGEIVFVWSAASPASASTIVLLILILQFNTPLFGGFAGRFRLN